MTLNDEMAPQKRGNRKVRSGVVLSNKMDKTVVVQLEQTLRHPKYGKVITRREKVYAHDDANTLKIGDEVVVEETRPLSKLKRWRVVTAAE